MACCAVKAGSKRELKGTKFQSFSDGLGWGWDYRLVLLAQLKPPQSSRRGWAIPHWIPWTSQPGSWACFPGAQFRVCWWGITVLLLGLPLLTTVISRITLYVVLDLWGRQICQQGVGGPLCILGENRGWILQSRRTNLQTRLSGRLILYSSTMNSGSPTCYGSVLDVTLSCISFWSLMKNDERVIGTPGLLEGIITLIRVQNGNLEIPPRQAEPLPPPTCGLLFLIL